PVAFVVLVVPSPAVSHARRSERGSSSETRSGGPSGRDDPKGTVQATRGGTGSGLTPEYSRSAALSPIWSGIGAISSVEMGKGVNKYPPVEWSSIWGPLQIRPCRRPRIDRSGRA